MSRLKDETPRQKENKMTTETYDNTTLLYFILIFLSFLLPLLSNMAKERCQAVLCRAVIGNCGALMCNVCTTACVAW